MYWTFYDDNIHYAPGGVGNDFLGEKVQVLLRGRKGEKKTKIDDLELPMQYEYRVRADSD